MKEKNLTRDLLGQTVIKFISGVLLVAILLFLPAGTLDYLNGWLLMAVLFLPMLPVGILLMVKAPELLKKRVNGREKLREQGQIVKLSGLMFVLGFLIAGLDFRFGWSSIPGWISNLAAVIFLFSYLFYAEVLRENRYLSRKIEVQEGQTVIDTGLYGLVRHPMYTATVLLFLMMPLILGSLWSLLIFLFYPLIIAGRIKGEERFLMRELAGYCDYQKKVKYRLIPFIW